MFAKQTLSSASLVGVLFGVLAPIAVAEPGPSEHADGEAALTPPSETPVTPPPPKSLARRPTGWFQIGAGYRTDDGFIATAGVGQDDLFGTGNMLSVSSELSRRRQRFGASLMDPALFGSRVSLSADVYNERRLLPGMWRNATGVSLSASTKIGEHLRVFVGYRLESVEVEPEHLAVARGLGASQLDRYRVGALRAGYAYDTRDNRLAPRRGVHVGSTIEVLDRDLGSQVQLLRLESWGEVHRPIGPATLHLTGRMSSVFDDHFDGNLAGAPHAERLFLDGSSELRGYRPGQLMPQGGTMKALGRAELEVPLISKWGVSAVGFLDGAALGGDGRIEAGLSTGVGLLWRSPIGPLRFDWAFPLDGSGPVFLFNVGF